MDKCFFLNRLITLHLLHENVELIEMWSCVGRGLIPDMCVTCLHRILPPAPAPQ